jgi:hypothetical protein
MGTVKTTPAAIQDEWAFDEAKNSYRLANHYAKKLGAALVGLDPTFVSPGAISESYGHSLFS